MRFLEARVQTDASVVEQILSNLLDNATKYASHAKDRRILLDARTSTGGFRSPFETTAPAYLPRLFDGCFVRSPSPRMTPPIPLRESVLG